MYKKRFKKSHRRSGRRRSGSTKRRSTYFVSRGGIRL